MGIEFQVDREMTVTDPNPNSSRQLDSGQVRSLLSLGLAGSVDGTRRQETPLSPNDLLMADPALLQQALNDLKTPCPVDGPFSIWRLSETNEEPCCAVEGRSWLKLLSSRETSSATRSRLLAVGRFLRQSGPSELSQLTGAIIESLANPDDSNAELSSLLQS